MTDLFALLIELLKLILPALVLVAGAYYLLQKHYEREDRLRTEQAQENGKKGEEKGTGMITTIRLQAYERIVLLLERITPSNLLLRVSPMGQTASEYHRVLLAEIRSEFSHNMSQQVYMSEQAWQQVNLAREEVVNMINKNFQDLPAGARGTDLAKLVLENVLTAEQDPTARALNFVKQEIRQVF